MIRESDFDYSLKQSKNQSHKFFENGYFEIVYKIFG